MQTHTLLEEKYSENWFPKDYTPGFSVKDWIKMLNDPEFFTSSNLEIMARMLDFGGAATCKQLSNKYGEHENFYNSGSSKLAERIHKKTNCPVLEENTENARWWPILYVGRYNEDKNVAGRYIWKLRPELAEALKQINLSEVKLYAENQATEQNSRKYYLLAWNPQKGAWSYGNNGKYSNKGEKEYYQAIEAIKSGIEVKEAWRCSNSHVKPGDKVFMIKLGNGIKGIFAYGIVEKAPYKYNYEGEKKQYIDVKFTSISDYRKKILLQDELIKKFPEQRWSPQSSGIEINEKYREELETLWNNLTLNNDVYSIKNFLSEVFMTQEKYETLKRILKHKKNIILQGAPGVGKTFAAKRLAYSIMEKKDESRIEFVQFHQNYSYEDFVMGYKPNKNGFNLEEGIFYSFCLKAAKDPEKDYFFIIDEINRGNMSKIFGELLMLIEKDYRNHSIKLAYSDIPFSVPENLHIIGMMNTADRSLAMIDYALRRRFSFFDIEPGFESDGFKAYQAGLNNKKLDKLVNEIKSLNNTIIKDKSLGKGFCIGHSYFCGKKTCSKEWLQDVVEYDILPMLAEYWFDDLEEYNKQADRLLKVIK